MTKTTPSDFGSHDEWLAYVRSEIPVAKQPLVLAFGRTELFRSLYPIQSLPFPTHFGRPNLWRDSASHRPCATGD